MSGKGVFATCGEGLAEVVPLSCQGSSDQKSTQNLYTYMGRKFHGQPIRFFLLQACQVAVLLSVNNCEEGRKGKNTNDRARIFKSPRVSVSTKRSTAAWMPTPASPTEASGKTSNISFKTTMALYTCMNSLVWMQSMMDFEGISIHLLT